MRRALITGGAGLRELAEEPIPATEALSNPYSGSARVLITGGVAA